MRIDINRIPKVLHTISFEVSGDPDWSPYDITVTKEDAKALGEAFEAAQGHDEACISKIQSLIQRSPHLPMFKNHLFSYYFLNKLAVEAQQVIDMCTKTHPNYFYNRIMQAQLWLQSEAHASKLPDLMQHWDIVAYAGRSKFEGHEVRAYYLAAADYHLQVGKITLADGFVYFLEAVSSEPDHKNIQMMRKKVDIRKGPLRKDFFPSRNKWR